MRSQHRAKTQAQRSLQVPMPLWVLQAVFRASQCRKNAPCTGALSTKHCIQALAACAEGGQPAGCYCWQDVLRGTGFLRAERQLLCLCSCNSEWIGKQLVGIGPRGQIFRRSTSAAHEHCNPTAETDPRSPASTDLIAQIRHTATTSDSLVEDMARDCSASLQFF